MAWIKFTKGGQLCLVNMDFVTMVTQQEKEGKTRLAFVLFNGNIVTTDPLEDWKADLLIDMVYGTPLDLDQPPSPLFLSEEATEKMLTDVLSEWDKMFGGEVAYEPQETVEEVTYEPVEQTQPEEAISSEDNE